MSISGAMNNALSGLSATGRMADVTANNLANALTPGYARKTVSLEARIVDGTGAGVRAASTDRTYAPELTLARRSADGELANAAARGDALAPLALAVGAPNDPGSLFARYEAFESSLRHLADTPESAARQLDTVLAARDIASTFHDLADAARTTRQHAEDGIARLVTAVNSDLGEIAKLNRDIRTFHVGGRDTSALEDRREYLIDEVASIIPVRTRPFEDGTVAVMTREGVTLATTKAETVAFAPTALVTPGMAYAGGTGTLSGLAIGGTDITPGGPGSQAVAGGALAGLFEVRDRAVPEFQAQIDALTADLVGRFETAGLDPTVAAGSPGLFTDAGGPLDPAATLGLSGRIAVSAAADPTAGGNPARLRDGLGATAPGPSTDATLPVAMLDILTEARDSSTVPGLAGFRSSAESVAAFSELRDTMRVGADASRAALTAAREALANSEAGVIGVDTDAELQNLLLIEQAYAANAQVLRTAAAMLDELRNLT